MALYGVAAVVATADALGSFRSAFIAGGAPGLGEPGAGDHLQTVYRFWLVGHQLGDGAAPWRDPYSFQPLVEPQLNLAGWPFGLPFWPLEAAFGPVVAWNTLLLTCVVIAGLATYGWLRLLKLPPAAATLGGLAFAIAPYRLAQSAGHLLGWIAVLLPVALYAFERSRAASSRRAAHAWGFGAFAALVSLPLSGQVHLAVGALPFCLAYAIVRRSPAALGWIVAACVAGSGVGIALRETVIAGSLASTGRTIDQVEMFQAGWLDLVSRFRRRRSRGVRLRRLAHADRRGGRPGRALAAPPLARPRARSGRESYRSSSRSARTRRSTSPSGAGFRPSISPAFPAG